MKPNTEANLTTIRQADTDTQPKDKNRRNRLPTRENRVPWGGNRIAWVGNRVPCRKNFSCTDN